MVWVGKEIDEGGLVTNIGFVAFFLGFVMKVVNVWV
jgi:hypothetical protein